MGLWPKKATRKYYATLPMYQDAIVRFYAERYQREFIDIVRTIISQYAKADKRFNVEEYQKWVGTRYIEFLKNTPEPPLDDEMLEELDRQLQEYLGADYDPSSLAFKKDMVAPPAKKKGRR